MYKFLDVNISAITFSGISSDFEKKTALVGTVIIWSGLALFLYEIAAVLDALGFADQVGGVFLAFMLIYYASTSRVALHDFAQVLLKITPMGVLYRQDMSIIDDARLELLQVVNSIDLSEYVATYGKVNPAIKSSSNLIAIKQQKLGRLDEWSKELHNLKSLADLVYQIHLVERELSYDCIPSMIESSN